MKKHHYTLLVTVYSKFEYSNLQLSSNSFAKSGKIEVSVYKKYRKCCGKEVVQLYIRDLSVTRVKELKGFEITDLHNETKKVFTIDQVLPMEAGDFKICRGSSMKVISIY
jgi:beta-glucosidase